MSNESLVQSILAGDPVAGLELAWSTPELTLAERAQLVSTLHMRSRLTLEGTARMAGATTAEVQALLELATLDDDDLELVSRANPPATTYFLFAGADSDAIRAGIAALGGRPNAEGTPSLVSVYDAMRTANGPSIDERVAAISGVTLSHLWKKANEYDILAKSARGLLVSLSKRKKTGTPPTERQLEFLKDVLLQLVQAGVVCRDSADDDQVMCDEVLDALGI